MTIAFPLTLPATPGFSSFTLRPRSVVGVSSSPYSGVQQVYAFPGQWWEADVGLPDMTRADANLWRAFVLSLNGREGTFYMGDPNNATPQGAIGGTPLANGAVAVGAKTLPVKGCSNSITNWFKAGDFFSLGASSTLRMYMATKDVSSDGSGNLTLDIWPAIRVAAADGDALTITNVKGLFRLADDNMGDTARPYPFFSRSFKAIEAI